MPSLLPLVLLVALLLPAIGHADTSNSFTDPFSPMNPNSFVAQDRQRQQVALVKQRQTWWDRFRQRLDSTWMAPAGTRFFARLFQRQSKQADPDAARKWGADIFTRYRRVDRVAYSTMTTGTGHARFMDKVSRNAPFVNTGGFGETVQRAVPETRLGYWDARGGKLMARVFAKVREMMRNGARRLRNAEGRPGFLGGAAVDERERLRLQQEELREQQRRLWRQQRKVDREQGRHLRTPLPRPVWRIHKR